MDWGSIISTATPHNFDLPVKAIITAADDLNLLQTEIEVLLSPQMARRCMAKPQFYILDGERREPCIF